jgi:hypothetical protein
MKIPGPNGIITIHGDPNPAFECKCASSKMADAVIAAEENKEEALDNYSTRVDSNSPSTLKKPMMPSSGPATPETTTHTCNIDLAPGDSTKQVIMDTSTTEK